MGFFDNLFGKKKDEKKDDKNQQIQEPLNQKKRQVQQPEARGVKEFLEQSEDDWIYELVLQYLISPIWKVTISEFLDEHCIVFDDEEENKFSYYDLHKKFKKMMEDLVDGMINEIGIVEEQFGVVIEKGLKSQTHRKYFEQLLIIDNFLVFKKLMIKRNKENELEALKEIQNQDAQQGQIQGNKGGLEDHSLQIKKLELEREKAELEHALAMTQAVEEERKKMLQLEESELDEAIRQSELEYKKQQLFLKKQQEDEERQMRLSMQQDQKQQGPAEQTIKKDDTPTPRIVSQVEQQIIVEDLKDQFKEQKKNPSLVGLYGAESQIVPNVIAQKAQEQDIQIRKKQSKLQPIDPLQSSKILGNALPPIGGQQRQSEVFGFEPESQSIQDRSVIQAQIDKIKQQQVEINRSEDQVEKVESTEERKKRLLQQRELIKQKKHEQNEKELQKQQEQYKPVVEIKQAESQFIEEQKKGNTDLQRRKDLLEQKKKQMMKAKEEVNYEENLM